MRIGFIARPIPEDFEFAALKSFPCVELNLFSDLSPTARASEIRGCRQKYGVDISQVGLFGRNYLTEDAGERRAHLEALRQATDFAKAIGAPIVTTGGGLDERLSLPEACGRSLEILTPSIRYAESLGLRFAFYNCHWANFIRGPEAWQIVLTELPGVGIKFDPSHPVHAGQDWAAQLASWGHRVIHAHAKDTVLLDGRPFEDVPAGLGDIHWGRFFALLYHHGYTGDINIEPHSRTWDGDRLYPGILLARRHLEQFLAPSAMATPRDLGV